MSKQPDQVEVRLVTTYYQNRIEYEEGPGSAADVVSDSTDHKWNLGRMPLAEAEAMTKGRLYEEFGFDLEEDSADGFEEFWHRLEYRDPETGKWRFLANLW